MGHRPILVLTANVVLHQVNQWQSTPSHSLAYSIAGFDWVPILALPMSMSLPAAWADV